MRNILNNFCESKLGGIHVTKRLVTITISQNIYEKIDEL